MKNFTHLMVLSFWITVFLNISAIKAENLLNTSGTETRMNAVSGFSEKAIPDAVFQADLTLIPKGNSVNFTDQSTGSPTSWAWTFTGGTPSSYSGKVPPPVYYNTAGTYDVSLTVSNADGSDTETKSGYITVANYPTGWEFTQTATSHLISISTSVQVIGSPLSSGDYVGVFYLDGNSELKCGGATIWDGVHNKVVVAFGDDATTTPLKEGFASAESFVWKVYFTALSLESSATVTYNQNLPQKDGKFYDLGLSALTSITTNTGVLAVVAEAVPSSVCVGLTVQLNATPSGGSGTYTYAWTSDPAGFTSSLQNPTATPSVNTTYYVTVYDGPASASSSVSVTTQIPSSVDAGANASICQGETHTLSGTAANYSSVLWSTSGNGTFSSTSSLTPVYTPGSSDITAGTVTLTLAASPISPCAVTASDTKVLTIQKSPVVNAGTDATICQTGTHTLAGTSSYSSSVLWTTNGNGTFNNASSLTAIYTPGSLDVAAGSATLTLTAQATSPCSGSVSDTKILTVRKSPTSYAGTDATVCQGTTHQLAGEATNYSTVSWVTSGNGTFSNATILNPIYTPGSTDISNGNVLLTMTVTAQSPCTGSVSDSKILTVRKTPVVNAGADVTICQGSTNTQAATASNYSSILWSTSGNGTFSSTSSLTAVYTPGSTDITNGTVTLTLTAQPNTPCSGAVSDSKIIVIQKLPTANAGADATICQTGSHSLLGVATNYSSVLWTTSGNGTFSSTSSLTPVYTPGSTEIASGTVTLTLTASAVSPCSTSANDAMVLSIVKSPTANAGDDATICQGSTHTLSGTASNYASILWTTTGNGSFSSASSLTAIYTPGSTDITNGTVTLTLTAQPNSPCSSAISDAKTVVIQKLPVANAGADASICQTGTYTLQGSATYYSSLLWTTSGNGTFSSTSSLTPVYTPGSTEIASGTVTLTLTASAVSPCSTSSNDGMVLSIVKSPTANAGDDATICQGSTHTLSGTFLIMPVFCGLHPVTELSVQQAH